MEFLRGRLQSTHVFLDVSRIANGHDLDLSTAAREALLLAEREADKLGHPHIQNGHLLLGLVESTHGSAAELLLKEGLSADQLRRQLESFGS